MNSCKISQCQFSTLGLNEAKINKFVSSQSDMIVNFDFYTANEKFVVVSWSRDQHLRLHSMEMSEIAQPPLPPPPSHPSYSSSSTAPPSSNRNNNNNNNNKNNELLPSAGSKEDEDIGLLPASIRPPILPNAPANNNTTTNSSRKSSFSEPGGGGGGGGNLFGTPPIAHVGASALMMRPSVTFDRDHSLNWPDDESWNTTAAAGFMTNQRGLGQSISISMPHSLMKSAHDFLKKNPKCFGARFTSLPEVFAIYANDGLDYSIMQSSSRNKTATAAAAKDSEYTPNNKRVGLLRFVFNLKFLKYILKFINKFKIQGAFFSFSTILMLSLLLFFK